MTHETATALIAAGSALLGATARGLWAWVRSRGHDSATVEKARIEDGATMRSELWEEIEKLRSRMDAMQEDLDKSRRAFLELLTEHTALKGEYRALKHEHDELQIRYAALERRIDNV